MTKRIEQLIDEALKKEPTFQLRKDFKDRVIQSIRKKEKANQRKLYLWMAMGTLIIIGLGYGIISYFLPTMLESFKGFNGSNQIIPLGVLVGIITIVIQYLDKRLVKDKMLHV